MNCKHIGMHCRRGTRDRHGNGAYEIDVCMDCGAWLSLGPSNDRGAAVGIEMALAELLAETECYWAPCAAKDEQYELYIDLFATDDPPNPNLRKPGPRSPVEMMVDRACGFDPSSSAAGDE